MYMMCGIPGSGKSTLAAEIAKKENATIISLDSIRKILCGDENNQSRNYDVVQIAKASTIASLKSGRNVVIDSTNYIPSLRKTFLQLLSDKDIAVACVFENNKELAKQRNFQRAQNSDKSVPEEVIDRMSERFVPPKMAEGFDKIFYNQYPYLHLDKVIQEIEEPEI